MLKPDASKKQREYPQLHLIDSSQKF